MSVKSRAFTGAATLAMVVVAVALFARAGGDSAKEIAHGAPAQPMIHGARIVGSTPGRPFLFLVPATGEGPLTFSAEGLPAGLTLDAKTGIISGSLQSDGTAKVKLTVSGPQGSLSRGLTIVGGRGKLALTPPMGWNSWNVWGLSVDDAKVRAAADAMVASGLAAKGFQYINIDDGWENGRAPDGKILPNEKFPDMKALADYVHSKGLKLGIYSSPGPKTCGRYEGSKGHEEQDAESYAEWGMDYLKYDWCSYKIDAAGAGLKVLKDALIWFKAPYDKMGGIMAGLDRDIVYCICFYGLWDVEKWGPSVGGNQWRTTGDIRDTWDSMSGIGFKQNGMEQWAGPGHWNDPDMLVVGQVGWGPSLHKTRLTPDEQITHITLWAMLASPLLIGCDMSNLDQLTLDLLTNGEVIDVDQDPLGKQASRKAKEGDTEVWARPLFDGTTAVALFNRGKEAKEVAARWADLGLSGKLPVRDLWRQRDLGTSEGSFQATVPSHGAVMLKIGTPRPETF
ncbi:MAG TPA: putative Ig domain-containing protein [bacterium]|nr:putative Ig domain-containing protein [bacterium]